MSNFEVFFLTKTMNWIGPLHVSNNERNN